MPVVIFSHALILNKNPHLWTDTIYYFPCTDCRGVFINNDLKDIIRIVYFPLQVQDLL